MTEHRKHYGAGTGAVCIGTSPFADSRKLSAGSASQKVARQLIAGQHEPRRHQHHVARERVPEKHSAAAPHVERDQDEAKRKELADLDPHVERHHVRHEAVLREREILQLRREAQAVKEAEEEQAGHQGGAVAEQQRPAGRGPQARTQPCAHIGGDAAGAPR